jgi:hypothetical protein
VAHISDRVPPQVKIQWEPREHEVDPKLGIEVEVDRKGEPRNRLVTIGDSITQGFMSAAVFRTDRSWPTFVAHELGLRPRVDFRYPVYEPPSGPGGLPFDLERAVRGLEGVVGRQLDWYELVRAGLWLRRYMDRVEDFWEDRGDDTFKPAEVGAPYHNLAVYGADLVDVQFLDLEMVNKRLAGNSNDALLRQVVEGANDRAWRVVLDSCKEAAGGTVLDAARAMGEEGDGEHGIETLVVMLGANNALGSILSLDTRWTNEAYGGLALLDRLEAKHHFNVWQPSHFENEWDALIDELRTIRARHVIIATVPQVTIAPLARGVKGKARNGSRYFPYYTRPWITDNDFDANRDPRINEDQAREIDSAIDAYNHKIIKTVKAARESEGLDWYLFDLGGLLDRMAYKRYATDPEAQPTWWKPYELPPVLAALRPTPDTRFFAAGPNGRQQGGLFSLDGIHPTTIASGIIAREIVRIMDRDAGVTFPRSEKGKVDVDFERVLALDTLNSQPPTTIDSIMSLLGWFDDKLGWVRSIRG